MKQIKIFLLLLFLHCALGVVHSQKITVPYQFGFEKDDPENKNWKLNTGSRGKYCADKWTVGNLEFNEGYQSLYISSDKGVSSKYAAQPNVVVASRILELETGNYDVSFDWKVGGETNISELFVCALPDGYSVDGEILESNDTIGYFPKVFSRFIMPLTTVDGVRTSLANKRTWSNASFQFSVVAGRKIQLAFVWVNFNQDTTIANPLGACIDNIQITSAMCPKPEKLSVETECGVLKLNWTGFAPKYECGYKPVGSKFWNNEYDIAGEIDNPSFTWEDMPEGAYDVRVRAIIDKDTSAYVYLNTVVVWCPENHCFDFVSLDNTDIVTCERGQAIENPLSNPGNYKFYPAAPSPSVGGNNTDAQHIACWIQGVYDPNTGNKLRTIPEGDLASVRLGNENAGSQAERITYEFDVVDDLVLLMKYAVVLENPGHGAAFDPYFGLQVLKEDGTPISKNASCGEAFFSPGLDPNDWNTFSPSLGVKFVWRDWTTIGIDLRECKGQRIKIQLTTQDCTLSKHAGYAYFTLDCIDATIKSEGCDTIELAAPSGFKYLWYNEQKKDFRPVTTQSIKVQAGDTTTYFCDVTYIDKSDCSFTLSSSVIPQYPKAQFNCLWQPQNCNNILKFDNQSYVYARINDTDSIIKGKRCAHYEWEFDYKGDVYKTDLVNPKYTIPNEGGDLNVRFSAYLEDEKCIDVIDTIINVKPIHDHNIALKKELCYGSYVIFGDTMRFEPGVFVDSLKNMWGCDSIVTMDLKVRPMPEDVMVYDTICSSDPYIFGGKSYTTSCVDTLVLQTNDSLGCDSIVILNLFKVSPIEVIINEYDSYACADDSVLYVSYENKEGARSPLTYSIIYDDFAKSVGFVDSKNNIVDPDDRILRVVMPENCRPNHYKATIVFHDTISVCSDSSTEIEFDVYYSASILQSKFGNMITVFDSAYNGGYSFTDYQWYMNNTKLEGQKDPFYYAGEGYEFLPGECYYLELTRKDDGVVTRTCEICPGGITPIDDIYLLEPYVVNTLVGSGLPIYIENIPGAIVNLYSATGQLIESMQVTSQNVEIKAPMKEGVYLLQVVTSAETFVTKIIVNTK